MKKIISVILCAISLTIFALDTEAQVRKLDRQRAQDMLKAIKDDIKKYYYDPNLRGVDLETRFKEAHQKIEQATSVGHIMGIIAQVLVDFNDSHTRFVPPVRTTRAEYGWKMQIIGEKCFVTAVQPGSDAEKKGLKVGDEVWSIDGFAPTREILWKIQYFYYSLRPQPAVRLVVRRPNGNEEELNVAAKLTVRKKVLNSTINDMWDSIRREESEAFLHRNRYVNLDENVFVWKMPHFNMSEAQIDEMMGKAKKYPSLILDLRGNGGGAVTVLNRLVGHFFDRDVKIADWKGRSEYEPQIAKTRGDKSYKGKVVVLIDSESASAAEIFARVMQLEKRGAVIGDRSSGAVMVSRYYQRQIGADALVFFGTNITIADLIMTDGKSLEIAGVIPDETLLLTARELADNKDSVMVRAAAILGVKLDPVTAGKLFPIEWER